MFGLVEFLDEVRSSDLKLLDAQAFAKLPVGHVMQKVSLASEHKTTELGDFTPNDNGRFHECPWCFGDTLISLPACQAS